MDEGCQLRTVGEEKQGEKRKAYEGGTGGELGGEIRRLKQFEGCESKVDEISKREENKL